MPEAPVLFEELTSVGDERIGLATLNAEKTLNSLSLPMIELLTGQLSKWRDDDRIAMVIVQGAGERAFSAGGDIQDLYESMVEHAGERNPYAERFFEEEYRLDYFMHTYPKPLMAWANGIVMGGGLGVMAACSHRIGTEQSHIAMPEITIGLFPDAGATWFLTHMPEHLAYFLAWTGSHLNAVDARRVGFIDHLAKAQSKDSLIEALQKTRWEADAERNRRILTEVITGFEGNPRDFPEGELERRDRQIADLIDDCLGQPNPATAFANQIDRLDSNDKWLARGVATFRGGSPTTARIIAEQIKRATGLGLEETFMLELVIAVQCARHPDFVEGVRALIIDKDNAPQWKYPDIMSVPDAWVEEHFASPFDGDHPLSDLKR